VTRVGAAVVPSIKEDLGRGAEIARGMLEAALGPARFGVDAYEVGIRMAADLQLGIARTVRTEPVRTLAASSANLTRDLGAAQLSTLRWFLDA
jgi:hypothetical protein